MKKKIKVLQMPVTNNRGGVTQYVLNNLAAINSDRFIFDFATRSERLDFAPEIEALGGRVHRLSCSSLEDEPRFIREMEAILADGYDAVHLHTTRWTGFLAEELAMKRKVPRVIIHSHSTMVEITDPADRQRATEMHERLKKAFSAKLASHFCACSHAAADWLFGEQIPRKNIQILHNAIPEDAFSFNPRARENMRRELGLEDRLVLGHVGRFAISKNHRFLLDVLQGSLSARPNAFLVLVGAGELLEQTRHDAHRRGLGKNVIFLEKRNDVSDIMQAMDIYLQPSHFEGLPLVLIEAQAAGLPCLVSDTITREVQVCPWTVFLPLNAREWIDSALKTAETHERRDGSRLVRQAGYSTRDQVRKLEDLYTP